MTAINESTLKVKRMKVLDQLTSSFVTGLEAVAWAHDYELRPLRATDDGFVEAVFVNKYHHEEELSLDFRVADEEFKEKRMLEVRDFDGENKPYSIFISPVPYVLFGILLGEP